MPVTKECATCHKDLPLSEFWRRRASRDGYLVHCKRCHNHTIKKRRFGLRRGQYDLMMARQNGRCAICGIRPRRSLAVDHNHRTGKVRDLLCSNCNLLVGMCKEKVSLLTGVIKYLKRWADE